MAGRQIQPLPLRMTPGEAAIDHRQAVHGLEVLRRPHRRRGEDDLFILAKDRQEPALMPFALALLAGLDRRLVDRQHLAVQDVLQLRSDDGFEQGNAALDPVGQGAAAERDARIRQALMLAIQGQVIRKLVDQHAGQDADVGHAAREDGARPRRADQFLAGLVLDDRADVLQHHIAAGLLSQPIAAFLTDGVVLIGLWAVQLLRGERDGLDRDIRAEAQALVGHISISAPLLALASLISNGFRRCGLGRLTHQAFEQGALVRIRLDQAAFALRAEALALEPVQLLLEGLDGVAQLAIFRDQRGAVAGCSAGALFDGDGVRHMTDFTSKPAGFRSRL